MAFMGGHEKVGLSMGVEVSSNGLTEWKFKDILLFF